MTSLGKGQRGRRPFVCLPAGGEHPHQPRRFGSVRVPDRHASAGQAVIAKPGSLTSDQASGLSADIHPSGERQIPALRGDASKGHDLPLS